MDFYIKTLDFFERIMNAVMTIDPGQQPFISQDLEELNKMRNGLLKAGGQAKSPNENSGLNIPVVSVSCEHSYDLYENNHGGKVMVCSKCMDAYF